MYKVGIDLSTNSTGIGIIRGNNAIYGGVVETLGKSVKFSADKATKDIELIHSKLEWIFSKYITIPEEEIIVAIEIPNHASNDNSLKFGVYCGIFISKLSKLSNNITFKFVNPRQWQLRVFGSVTERQEGKEAAIAYSNANFSHGGMKLDPNKIGQGHDDIADALCIASVADKVLDNRVVKNELKHRNKTKTSSKAKISTITTNLTNIKNKILDKKEKEISRINSLKKWVINPSKYKTTEAYFKRQEMVSKAKNLEISRTNKPLWDYATTLQKDRILKYKEQLEKLKADLTLINEFKIMGKK